MSLGLIVLTTPMSLTTLGIDGESFEIRTDHRTIFDHALIAAAVIHMFLNSERRTIPFARKRQIAPMHCETVFDIDTNPRNIGAIFQGFISSEPTSLHI